MSKAWSYMASIPTSEITSTLMLHHERVSEFLR